MLWPWTRCLQQRGLLSYSSVDGGSIQVKLRTHIRPLISNHIPKIKNQIYSQQESVWRRPWREIGAYRGDFRLSSVCSLQGKWTYNVFHSHFTPLRHTSWAFALLIQEGMLKRAYALTKELKRLSPDHPRVDSNLQYFNHLLQGEVRIWAEVIFLANDFSEWLFKYKRF